MSLREEDAAKLRKAIEKGEPEVIKVATEIVKGLVDKNTELKTEKDAKTKEFSESETARKAAEKSLEAEQAKVAELEEAAAGDDKEKDAAIEKLTKKFESKFAEMAERDEARTAEAQKIAATARVDAAISKSGVAENMQTAVKAMIMTGATLKMGDALDASDATFDGKSIEAHVNDWVSTDAAKPFLAGSGNTGGGAGGSKPTGGAGSGDNGDKKTLSQSDFDNLPQAEKDAHFENDDVVIVPDSTT